MQYELLKWLKCPVTGSGLRFTLYSSHIRKYDTGEQAEVKEGLLTSEAGFLFPVIDGVPRMLVEAIYDYADFLRKHVSDYEAARQRLEAEYGGLLQYCRKKNKKTKASFEFEWSFLQQESRDRIWHQDIPSLSRVFLNEAGLQPDAVSDKLVADIGCGHGVMTAAIAGLCKSAIGVELSKAVENAYRHNRIANAYYLQGDLQFLPFDAGTFDVLYSSGVIHHTNNTELSLSLIERTLKSGGQLALWLYHPRKSGLHNALQSLRHVFSRLPLPLSFVLILVFIFPFTFLAKLVRRRYPPNYREEIIDLLDGFTPEFREEVPYDLAAFWLKRRSYHRIEKTTVNPFGFSVAAVKE